MTKNVTLISDLKLYDEKFISDHLKLCVLWYDEVLLEDIWGMNITDHLLGLNKKDLFYLTDILLPLKSRVPISIINDYKRNCAMLNYYPRWERDGKLYNTYLRPKTAHEYAYNRIINRLRKQYGYNDYIYHMEFLEGHALATVKSVKLWEIVNLEIPCMLQTDEYGQIALNATMLYNNLETVEEAFTLFKLSVPDLTRVPWTKIIELRKKGGFSVLREKLGCILQDSSYNIKNAQRELHTIEQEAINEIIDEYKPKLKRVSIESLVGNIPMPFINPVSILLGAKNIKGEVDKKRKYSWFYLLRDIRSLSD